MTSVAIRESLLATISMNRWTTLKESIKQLQSEFLKLPTRGTWSSLFLATRDFGERSVRTILGVAGDRGIEVVVGTAVSAIDAIVSALDLDPMADEVQIVDAEELDETWTAEPFAGGRLGLVPTRPVLVTQMYSTRIASHVKLALARLYPEDHEVTVIRAAGVPSQESVIQCLLHEVDHHQSDHLTSLFLPPLAALESYRTAIAVQRLVARLRAPDGCPWDRKLTHKSLRDAILEEAFEVVEAIDDGDSYHLSEELGDLFLLVAMHSQIAFESGDFALEDVFEQISTKLIRRHPHVFGDVVAETPDQVVATWESVKRAERSSIRASEEVHPFDRLPRSMPALTRVAKVLANENLDTFEKNRNPQEAWC